MSRRLLVLLGLLPMLFTIATTGGIARASAGPQYDVKATWGDTYLTPGDKKTTTAEAQFMVQVRNVGEAVGAQNLTITDKLPAGVTATHIHWMGGSQDLSSQCSGVAGSTVRCTLLASQLPVFANAPGLGGSEGVGGYPEPSGYLPAVYIDVSIPSKAEGEGVNTAEVFGGSASLPDGSPCAEVEAELLSLPPCAEDTDSMLFSAAPSPFGVVPGSFTADMFDAPYPGGIPARRAGAHPFELRFNFDVSAKTGVNDGPGGDGTRYITSNGQVRTVESTLPRGAIGNPEALPKCDPAVFAETGDVRGSTACPPDTQIGYLNISTNDGNINFGEGHLGRGSLNRVPLYNIEPPKGTPIDLGFNAGGVVLGHIYATLDPAQNYAVKAISPDITSIAQARGVEVTIWGVPADPAHDKFRYFSGPSERNPALGAPWGSAPIHPFFTLPADCGFDNGGTRVRLDSYEHPEQFTPVQEYDSPLNVTGCDDLRFRFEPNISLQPTDRRAGAPTGLDVHLKVPQRNDEVADAKELYAENDSVKAVPTPPIKKAVVTFPNGVTLNPSAAQGLGSCSLAQIGISPTGVPNDKPVTCPDNSQYGTLILHTPILPENKQPEGHIYIAKQGENPSGDNFLTLYLVIEEPEQGILVKIPGKVDLDHTTGQITSTFDDLPQFPVSDMQLTLKGGVRAGLVEPATCGERTITAELFSWQEPSTSHVVKSSYDVTEKPDGSPCVNNLAERQFKPLMEAGTTNNIAGSYAPFAFRLTRTDEDQEFSRLGVSLPPGLAAKFAGVSQCSDAAIAQAEGRREAGEGALEQLSPSCPANSLIGQTEVGTGVGVPLTWVPGKVYLAGPYRGAPLSMVVISPAVVGPFDLGVIVVRTTLNVNPETAQGSAVSDPLPQIFQGIPVRIRDIRLNLDRSDFTLNPTNCAEKQIEAHITGTGGDVNTTADDTGADLSSHFQVADCASLGFRPKLAFRLVGGTKRGGHPSLRATVTYPKHGAYSNIARASVALPQSEFLDQGHIGTVCTRVQFAAKQCPAASVYGHAVAKTPLFAFQLEGPVYLRSSSHKLPDLVAALKGPASMPIEVDLDGRVDSVNGGIRNTFEVVPDAPVESFKLTLQGAKKGLLVNSTDICAKVYRATAKFGAQNGRRLTERPALRAACHKRR